jgi:hypothetical protein
MYFGKTVQKNPVSYTGSGKVWKRHIEKHGVKQIDTLWYCLFTDLEELVKFATYFSKINDIVKSKHWANLMEETGLSGGEGYQFTEQQRQKMSKSASAAVRTYVQTEEHKRKVSEALKGRPQPKNPNASKKCSETVKAKKLCWMHNIVGKNIRVKLVDINEAIAQGCLMGYKPGTHNGFPDNTGRKHSKETIEKMRATYKRRTQFS